jgi:hypothetical protein
VTLRDRLQGKTRRRIAVPVAVSDPTAALERMEGARQRAQLAELTPAGVSEEMRAELEAAAAAVREHYVDVVFQSLPAWQFEAFLASRQRPDEDGEDSGVDWSQGLPVLAAECAEDDDLRDVEWWRGHLAEWSAGELTALRLALLHVNTTTPNPHVPKD